MAGSNQDYFQSSHLYGPLASETIAPGAWEPVPVGLEQHDIDYTERAVPHVPKPVAFRPTDEELFLRTPEGVYLPSCDFLKDHFFNEGRLTEEQALYILAQATDLLAKEPNLVYVESPVTICGDIHGQYYDLMKLFDIGGSFKECSYLFLGDYVDRGTFGIECLLYLYALKLQYPGYITLLRGNHECRHLTEYFTFKRECLHKYSSAVYDACITSFQALPLAALVDKRFFCVHGGISPHLLTLQDLHTLNRFDEPGSSGLLCDLLWSDPIADFGYEHEPSATGKPTHFQHNNVRGCSYFYTYSAACKFLETNGLLGIIRGHEAQDAGYTMYRKTPTKKFPSVITVFSAPNYLDVYHNRGAIIKYANKNITIRQYNSSAHPYWLPNFMDAFTWSLPFVGAKITEMLLAILSSCSREELEDTSESGTIGEDSDEEGEAVISHEEAMRRRKEEIKKKILAVGKMQRVFQLLREEAENVSELQAEEEGLDALQGPRMLGVQGNQMGGSIRNFQDARRVDMLNERLPTYEPPLDNADGADGDFPVIPAPSMRRRPSASGVPGVGGSGSDAGAASAPSMEELIRRTLSEEGAGADGGYVERIAERIARGRQATGRPMPLKRFETT
ncbi:Metallo-dependent phosphatase [Coniophora puteana RWD-64-598 SS2]|uniref:Serine/threonine-protein phosphatase n=1 Tax=Coniophora puteana (strain RWD-64-598) TaxID=741705 RepID=A0A5M3MA05_CONPW|nr:Metallo-dependent phosphatase [Coniophora puteana RWD-64-598 SS2]EIW75684.1 Metallo-dependent phosphatase [Coniophora puteana RWD-64-598 SS2]